MSENSKLREHQEKILVELRELWECNPDKTFHGLILDIGEYVTTVAFEVSDDQFLAAMERFKNR